MRGFECNRRREEPTKGGVAARMPSDNGKQINPLVCIKAMSNDALEAATGTTEANTGERGEEGGGWPQLPLLLTPTSPPPINQPPLTSPPISTAPGTTLPPPFSSSRPLPTHDGPCTVLHRWGCWSWVGLLVTGGAAGHRWGCRSQVGLLVTGGAAGHRWGCWSEVGLLVTGGAAGHRWGCWSQVGLLVTGGLLVLDGAAGHRWGCWSQVGLLVTGGAAGHSAWCWRDGAGAGAGASDWLRCWCWCWRLPLVLVPGAGVTALELVLVLAAGAGAGACAGAGAWCWRLALVLVPRAGGWRWWLALVLVAGAGGWRWCWCWYLVLAAGAGAGAGAGGWRWRWCWCLVAVASCSCRLLTHPSLLSHRCLGHPSLPCLRGMHSRLLVYGLPRSLPPLPRSLALPCLPCIEGRQCAALHSSFPPTTTPLQTLHMDVWGPTRVHGQDHKRYFLLVVGDYTRYTTVFPLQSKADVQEAVSFPPASLRNFVVRRASPSRSRIRPLRGRMGLLSVALAKSWRDLAYTALDGGGWRCVSVSGLGHALPCLRYHRVFLGFPTDTTPCLFYHPSSRRIQSSYDITFDESVYFYRLHPHASSSVPPPPLFLVPGPPPVDPLPLQGPTPSGVSQVDPPPLVEPLEVSFDTSGPTEGGYPAAHDTAANRRSPRLETPPGFPPRLSSPPLPPVAVDSGAFGGGDTGGADSGGAGPGVADSPGIESTNWSLLLPTLRR
ncbi:unnamed protein product [Closterium sp. NIES-54]